MSSPLARRPPAAALLSRMLDDPQLVPQLRALPVPVLRQVVQQIGLEDAGELVALASLEQLRGLFDEDLWRSPRPGADDAFDAARFVTWLEVLGESGDAFAADRLAELSEDFLFFAFSRLVRVLDTAEAAASLADADEADLLDKAVEAGGCQELDDYLVMPRREEGWDAVWSTLLALAERHTPLLDALLRRCWLATREQAEEVGGLHAVLSEEDALLEDARAEREDRRAAQGHVSPADARAFLRGARSAPDAPERDPITRAYFRELRPASAAAGVAAGASSAPAGPPPLRRLLAAAGVEPADETALPAETTRFRQVVAELAEADPGAHARVIEELAYLANVLVAGDASRDWRPVDAAERVLALCDEGLRAVLARGKGAGAEDALDALRRWGAVGLFRVAWAAG